MKVKLWMMAAAVAGVMGLSGIILTPTVGQRTLAQQSESSVANSSSIEGKLDSNSQTMEDESYFNVHTFQGKAGEPLIIDLISKDFDAYLILVDPNNNKIAENNDGGDENNARIVLTLPVTGTYTLIVNSAKAKESGSYVLSWREATERDIALAEAERLNQQVIQLYQQGKYNEAIPLAEQALAISKQQLGDNHPLTAASLNNLAVFYQSQDDIPQAINYLSQGLAVQEYNLSENLKMGDDKQKQDYMAKVLGTTDGVISLNLQAAPNNPEVTRLALKTILERKGRILDVSTNSLQILRQRTDDPESQQLLTQLIEVRTQLSNLTFKKPEDIKNPEIYRQQINEVTEKAKEIEGKIGVRSAEFRSLSQPITLEGIQKLIPADAALVEIVRYQPYNPKNDSFGIPRYAVYILYPNGDIKAKDLGEAKPIDDKLIYFRDNLADAETPLPQLQKSARQLDEILMQPIRQLLGNTKTILLSPDAALNLIPFEALVDENNQYLVENYHITYLTSGRDLLRLKDKFASQQSPLIVADPFYGKAGEKVALTRSIDLSEFTFPGLPGTEQEAKAIKNILPQATVLTGSQATENAVKQVKKPNILHIATHGFFKPESNVIENPLLRSGLVLAGVTIGQSAGDDGVLTALETTNLNLVGTKLVVLSACDTGKGDIKIGQGVYGLRRALVIAGSESQLISLWKVSDDATKDLMVAYYGRLQKGEGRSEALRQIQLGMLKGEKQKHPFYWASFIPSGDATSMEFSSYP
ncbi:MAG: CHAT domain-containing protein [Microcystis sp.]|uniref:CHAT domain-containing protein n=1 Tax=Microcystis sp. TaxID=1127 RepID=UPI0039193F49